MASVLAATIRVAQRMGLHHEASYARCTVLEAETRRRLWWSLVAFDHRMCEMSEYETTTLVPLWDCKRPLNVSDFELRTEAKIAPPVHEKPTEALFAVVRSELVDFLRHSTFHLNFINPSLNVLARPQDTHHGQATDGSGLIAFEEILESRYLAHCDPENPLHFMTIWTARGHFARIRLLEHYSRHSSSTVQQTEEQRAAAASYALSMIECDTKIRTSPLTRKYLWFANIYVPALAYIHLLNGMRKRPDEAHADSAWNAMSANYEARIQQLKLEGQGAIAVFFYSAILQTWEAREEVLRQQNRPRDPPRLVLDMQSRILQEELAVSQRNNGDLPNGSLDTEVGESQIQAAVDFCGPSGGGQYSVGPGPVGYPGMPGQPLMDISVDQFWTTADWRWMHVYQT